MGRFISSNGTLIAKDFYASGIFLDKYSQKVSFQSLVLFDPTNEKIKVKGLKVTFTNTKDQENSCFLDTDEISELIEAIDVIIKTSKEYSHIAKEYSEVIYKTKEQFSIGFFQDKKDQTCFLGIDSYPSITLFPKSFDDLGQIRSILVNSVDLLSKK